MVTDNQNLIWTAMTVLQDGVRAVTGRNGVPQYELKVRWEWTPPSNTWGDTTYVNKDISPEVITAGTYTVLARRDELKTNKERLAYDGSHNWMYRWRIAEWEGIAVEGVTTAPPQAAPAPAPQPTPEATPHLPVAETQPQYVTDIFAGIDPNQMRIMRQATLKCASWMVVPMIAHAVSKDKGYVTSNFVSIAEEMSEMFLEYVVTGNVYNEFEAEDLLNEEF